MHFLLSPFTCVILFCFWSQIGLFPAECCDCVHHTHAHMLTHRHTHKCAHIHHLSICQVVCSTGLNSRDAANSFEAKEQRSSSADIVPLEAELQREQKPARYNIENECGSLKFNFIYKRGSRLGWTHRFQFSDPRVLQTALFLVS